MNEVSPDSKSRLHSRCVPNLTVFVASAAIMSMEMTAGALISRHVGMSLYTWTSVIGVVMAGMAAGNWAGGWLSDRLPLKRTLAGLFFLAALGIAAILPLNNLLGNAELLAAQAWPVRIVLHNGGVFFAPALLLGAITPVVARLAMLSQAGQGKAVGEVFAWGVAGSIAGTFATGYYLVYLIGARELILTSAAVLATLGVFFLYQTLRTADLRPIAFSGGGAEGRKAWGALLAAYATVFSSNALFMILELAAARVVTRQFGASLYTWTGVIGIMLAGITLGNYLGGRLADRTANGRVLGRVFLLASFSVFAAPFICLGLGNILADSALTGLSWPLQISLYVLAAFFLPCVFIGHVSPIVVKRLLDSGNAPGSSVGGVYAWGSAGAIFGTFATGFVLVDWLWSLPVIGLVTACLAVAAVLLGRRQVLAAALWAPVALLLFASSQLDAPWNTAARWAALLAPQPPGTIYEDESQYSYIAVMADEENPNIREMMLDRLIHSQVDLEAPTALKYEYEWIYEAVLDKFYPEAAPITGMVIGGGGYAFPHYLEVARPGSYVETSEIDPAVTRAAFEAFGLPRDTKGKIYDMDARNRVADLMRIKNRGGEVPQFDCVFGDSINDYTVPRHLTTLEFARQIDALLKDDGLYMLNMIDVYDSGLFLSAIVTTLREVFPVVQVFNTGRASFVRDTFVVVCSKIERDFSDIPARIKEKNDYMGWEVELSHLITPEKALLLTDNHAPVDLLLRPVVNTRSKDRGEAAFDEATEAAAAGDLERALALCEEAAALHDRFPALYELMAAIYKEQGKTQEHVDALERATAGNIEPAKAWYAAGAAALEAGDAKRAYAAFERALAADDTFLPAHAALGAQALRDGRPDRALPHWQTAVSMEPRSVSAHYNLGLAYGGLQRIIEAIEAWKMATSLDPTHLDSWHNLAIAYQMAGKLDEARAAIVRIRELGGTPDPALVNQLGM